MDIIKDEIEIKKFYAINSKIILSIYEKGEEKTYMTTVRDFNPDSLFIDPVTFQGKKVKLNVPESVCISVSKLGAIWLGESQIKRYEKAPVEGYWVKYPKEIMKVQRRQLLRIDAMFDVKIKYYKRGIFYTSEDASSFDISGSGIGLISEEMISKTLDIQLDFIFKGLHITTFAEVIHSGWNANAELYYTGLRFLDLDPKDIDKLHKKVNEEQLIRKQMGSI